MMSLFSPPPPSEPLLEALISLLGAATSVPWQSWEARLAWQCIPRYAERLHPGFGDRQIWQTMLREHFYFAKTYSDRDRRLLLFAAHAILPLRGAAAHSDLRALFDLTEPEPLPVAWIDIALILGDTAGESGNPESAEKEAQWYQVARAALCKPESETGSPEERFALRVRVRQLRRRINPDLGEQLPLPL